MDLGKKLAEGFALDVASDVADAPQAVAADASGTPVPDTADPPRLQDPIAPATA